jgi:hypothetical protein
VVKLFVDNGTEIVASSAAEHAASVKEQYERWGGEQKFSTGAHAGNPSGSAPAARAAAGAEIKPAAGSPA